MGWEIFSILLSVFDPRSAVHFLVYINDLDSSRLACFVLALRLLNSIAAGWQRGKGMAMLKITKVQESGNDVLIKLQGKISEQWAALLDGECRAYLRQKKAVYLECSHVVYMDARGIEVVNNLTHKQVTLMSAPAFIMELLHVGGRS